MSTTTEPRIPTEGIKYTGSKLRLLPHIMDTATRLRDVHTVLDGFSGSTRVAQAFARQGYDTTANDIAPWSEVLGTCYLLPSRDDRYFASLLDHFNALPGYDGWFTQHYGGGEDEPAKRPFQRKNTRRLDAIRDEIDRLALPWGEKCVVLTSLILALDKVDNTLGHYAAYLAHWSRRSYNDLQLMLPRRFPLGCHNEVVRGDVFDLIPRRTFDLAYLDPPYGSNNEKMPPSRVRYAAYYHLWTTVVNNDRPPLFGRANRREDTRDEVAASPFEDYRKDADGHFVALEAIRRLIEGTQAHYLLLSYSSGGRATREQLTDILTSCGTLKEVKKIDYQRNIMSHLRSTHHWATDTDAPHCEYLFLLEK